MAVKKSIIQNIDQSFTDFLEYGDVDYLNSYLIENREDLSTLEMKGNNLLRQITFIAKATSQNRKNEELLLKVVHKFKEAIEKNQDKPIATLRQIIHDNPQAIRARNLDKLEEEDIKEIIKGYNLVELLNKLINEKDDKD